MGFFILLLFIGVPIVEIALFIQAGELIGLWPTIATVIVTAILGTTLLRAQGLSLLFKAQENLNQGIFPMQEAFDGLCLVVAGALLLTPGFLTDAVGFLLFVPPVRTALRLFFARHMTVATFGPDGQPLNGHPPGGAPGGRPSGDPSVIDGEFVDITPEEAEKMEQKQINPKSPWSQ